MMLYPSTARIRLKPLRLVSLLLFVMGIGLLSTSSSTQLSCDRTTASEVRCLLRNTTALGIVTTASTTIDSVVSVKLDPQVKRILNVQTEDSPPIYPNRTVYGVVIIGDEPVLLDAYDYDRDRQEQHLQKIQAFLQNPEQQQFTLDIRNLWSPVLTLATFGGAIALFFYSK